MTATEFLTAADPQTKAEDFLDAPAAKPPAVKASDFLDAPDKVDLTKIKPTLVNQPSQFSSGLPPGTPPADNPDASFTAALVNNPGKLATVPGAVLKLAGDVVRGGAADVVSKAFNDPEYGGNLTAITDPLSETGMPVDKFLGDVAKTNPNLAIVGKVSQGVAAAAPLVATGGLPAWAGKLVAAGFSAQMISQAPELARQLGNELGKPPEQRDPDKLTSLISDAIQTGVFAPLAGAHAGASAVDFLESKASPTTYVAKQIAQQLKTAPLDLPVKAGQVQTAEDFLSEPSDVVQTSELKPTSPAPASDSQTPLATSPQAESATPAATVETPAPAESEIALAPVQVSDAQIKSMRTPIDRPPDILDTIGDHFPNGVQFASKEDFGEYLNQAQGAAKELMSHTQGEPSDVVLDGLHLAGEAHGIENEDELAQAMVSAGKTRIGQRDDINAAAKNLAEEQARSQMFEQANRPTRPGVESMPAQQLFVGDTFKMNGQPMRVTGFATDGETGLPFGVEVDGAYGKQTLDANDQVHIDKGTLQEVPVQGRVAASGTSLPRQFQAPNNLKALGDTEFEIVPRRADSSTLAAGKFGTKDLAGNQTFDVVGKQSGYTYFKPRQIERANLLKSQLEQVSNKPGRVAGATPTRAPRPRSTMQVPPAIAKTPAPPTGPIRTWANNFSGGFKKVFAPHTIDSGASTVANILRDVNGEKANNLARADEAMHAWRKEFDQTPVPRGYVYDSTKPLPHNFDVIDMLERDRSKLPARYQPLAQYFDQAFQDRIKVIQQFAPNALQNLIKDYFPHIWEDPARAKGVMSQVANKLFAGRKEFLKQRSLPMFTDGLERGLKPISDNPVDLLLAKMHSMDKFIAALKAQAEFKAIGKMKFKYALEPMPDGWQAVDDPAFVVNAPPTVTFQEAFDATLRTRTFELLQKLGVKNSRLATLGGKRWGLAYESPEQIKTRFAGPMSVYFHELGHILDFRYDLQKDFLKQGKSFDQQLRYLSDRRLPTSGASKSYRAYVRNGAEKMAVMTEAYVHAPDIFKRVAPEVYNKFDQFIEDHPELHDIRDLKPSLRLDTAETEHKLPGMLKLGDWIMPDGPAAVMHNYLSAGMATKPLIGPVFRSVRAASNLLNAAQLGLSAFHVGFTSLDAVVNAAEVGMYRALHGDLAGGAKVISKAPIAPITNYFVGKAVQRAMLDAKAKSIKAFGFNVAINPAAHDFAQLAVKGGLRATVDPFWQTHMTRNLMRSVHEGGLAWAKTPLQAPLALVEQAMRPIAEYLVPRQKLGVFSLLAKSEMDRLPASASVADVRAAMARAADATEDRMGQMTYDNLFYNNLAKDAALIAFRAYGWQLGKYRHLIGAGADTVANARQIAAGKMPNLTHRQLYFVALPLIVGAAGGLLHYMNTGHAPQDLRDYLHPSTGQKDALGNDKRLSLPSYLKDLESDRAGVTQGWQSGGPLGAAKGVWDATYHRLNPWLGTAVDMFNNRDFYGTQIYNPNDSLMAKMADQAKFIAKGVEPFSIAGAQKMMEGEHSAKDLILPFVGVVPAKQAISMTPAQLKAAEISQAQASIGGRTASQAAHSQALRDAVADIKANKPISNASQLNKQDVTDIKARLSMTPLQFQVDRMPMDNAMQVYDLANPAEKRQLQPLLQKKLMAQSKRGEQVNTNYVHILTQPVK